MLRTILAGAAFALAASAASAEVVEVQMLNKHPSEAGKVMVFDPPLVRIQPGQTVRFLASDRGHNVQSVDGMLPEGAEEFRGRINEELEVTFDTPGVYGFKCLPHLAMGMVGLIVVEGEGWDANLEAARAVEHRGKAAEAFAALFAELDAGA
jgi:pseudoazurin